MDPPDNAFPVKYLVFDEGDGINNGTCGDFDTPFDSYQRRDATKAKKKKKKRKSRKDLRLAKRTSKILSNYRAFLNDHDMEIAMESSSDPPEDGFRDLHYYEHKTKNLTSSNHGSNEATTGLLRDFSTPEVPLGSSGDSPEKTEYKMSSILHSKRVKYGVLMSFVLLLVIVLATVATAKGSKKMKMPIRENTSGWHSEAAFILEREHGDEVKKLPHYDVVVPKEEPLDEPMGISDIPASQILEPIIENDILKETSETEPAVEATAPTESDAEGKIESAPTQNKQELEIKPTKTQPEKVTEDTAKMTTKETKKKPGINSTPKDAKTSATMAVRTLALEQVLHDKFKPLWLGSGEGWNGGSHDEAMEFCKSVRGKELCPYSAMCPNGPGSNVLAGRRPVDFSSQGEQYAPVYGHANRWIMVGRKNGDAYTTCMSHEQLEMRPPTWGLNGDRAEVKLHIMCCSVPKE